jgi:hypothetical protein
MFPKPGPENNDVFLSLYEGLFSKTGEVEDGMLHIKFLFTSSLNSIYVL